MICLILFSVASCWLTSDQTEREGGETGINWSRLKANDKGIFCKKKHWQILLSHFSFLFPSIYVSLQFWKRISWSEAMEWNGSRWLVTLFLYFPCIPLNSSTLSILFVLILFYLQYLIITIKTPAKKNFFFVQFRLYIPKNKKKRRKKEEPQRNNIRTQNCGRVLFFLYLYGARSW